MKPEVKIVLAFVGLFVVGASFMGIARVFGPTSEFWVSGLTLPPDSAVLEVSTESRKSDTGLWAHEWAGSRVLKVHFSCRSPRKEVVNHIAASLQDAGFKDVEGFRLADFTLHPSKIGYVNVELPEPIPRPGFPTLPIDDKLVDYVYLLHAEKGQLEVELRAFDVEAEEGLSVGAIKSTHTSSVDHESMGKKDFHDTPSGSTVSGSDINLAHKYFLVIQRK